MLELAARCTLFLCITVFVVIAATEPWGVWSSFFSVFCLNHENQGLYGVCGQCSPFTVNPAPDGHRCGVCPTYHQKVCALDLLSNKTYIFDNHCIMDLYNCLHGSDFNRVNYEECLYFGNFAYVHGIKYEDQDYDEDHIRVVSAKQNPDFV